jgi:hypothetical protein
MSGKSKLLKCQRSVSRHSAAMGGDAFFASRPPTFWHSLLAFDNHRPGGGRALLATVLLRT